jgi:hypothetical protein
MNRENYSPAYCNQPQRMVKSGNERIFCVIGGGARRPQQPTQCRRLGPGGPGSHCRAGRGRGRGGTAGPAPRRDQGQLLLALPVAGRAAAGALERWELFEQENVFGSLEDVADPRARLRALFQLVAHEVTPHVIYSELLKALDHPMVRPVIDRVSQRRLEYLVASFRQAGLSSTDARHRARLAYAAYVGFLQLSLQLQQPKQAREDFEAYVEHVIETLIPG